MSEKTNIAWTDSTVNFWSGCTKVSPGCAHCYAEARDKRHMIEDADHWGKGAPRLKHKGAVKDAQALNRKPWICEQDGVAYSHEVVSKLLGEGQSLLTFHRRRIFSLSLGDWLDDEVQVEWLAEMLDTIRQCDQVTWILCTKRPENFHRLAEVMEWMQDTNQDTGHDDHPESNLFQFCYWWIIKKIPPANIILLTSVENQEMADKRIPELLKIPAACRGLSLEPLLGPVDVSDFTVRMLPKPAWLIIGGESGAGARPCNVDWIRSLVEQGKSAGVATFVKQWGANPTQTIQDTVGADAAEVTFKLRDKKGGDMAEWPEDLRVREFPKTA